MGQCYLRLSNKNDSVLNCFFFLLFHLFVFLSLTFLLFLIPNLLKAHPWIVHRQSFSFLSIRFFVYIYMICVCVPVKKVKKFLRSWRCRTSVDCKSGYFDVQIFDLIEKSLSLSILWTLYCIVWPNFSIGYFSGHCFIYEKFLGKYYK